MFRPQQCSLHALDPARFDAFMAGRRLIMFGDSIMRIQWLSLACLLRSHVRNFPILQPLCFLWCCIAFPALYPL